MITRPFASALDARCPARALSAARRLAVARRSLADFRFVQLHGDRLLGAVAHDHDAGVRAGLRLRHMVAQAVEVADRLAVERLNHVAALQPGAVRGAVGRRPC